MCGFGDKVSRGNWSSKVSNVGTEDLGCVKAVMADTGPCTGQTPHHSTALYQTYGQRCQHQQGIGYKVSAVSIARQPLVGFGQCENFNARTRLKVYGLQ